MSLNDGDEYRGDAFGISAEAGVVGVHFPLGKDDLQATVQFAPETARKLAAGLVEAARNAEEQRNRITAGTRRERRWRWS